MPVRCLVRLGLLVRFGFLVNLDLRQLVGLFVPIQLFVLVGLFLLEYRQQKLLFWWRQCSTDIIVWSV